jgi:hypothetical protein
MDKSPFFNEGFDNNSFLKGSSSLGIYDVLHVSLRTKLLFFLVLESHPTLFITCCLTTTSKKDTQVSIEKKEKIKMKSNAEL